MAIFDKEANSYDGWYQTKLGSFIDKVESDCAFKLFKPKKGMAVLDIGCGTGNFSIKLAEAGCKVVGIDISEKMLSVAKEKAKEKGLDIEFYNMNIYELNFKNEYFDAVFSMAAFEFIKEPKKALDEIFRVVKKAGEILIGTINRDSSWGELYLTDKFQKNSIFKYADFKTLEDFKKIKTKNLVSTNECLFIPPTVKEEDINMDKELEYSKNKRGGFIFTLWKK